MQAVCHRAAVVEMGDTDLARFLQHFRQAEDVPACNTGTPSDCKLQISMRQPCFRRACYTTSAAGRCDAAGRIRHTQGQVKNTLLAELSVPGQHFIEQPGELSIVAEVDGLGGVGRGVEQAVVLARERAKACSPKSAATSDSKHQATPDQDGHSVEHSTRRKWGGRGLTNTREMDQNDVEVTVPLTPNPGTWPSCPLPAASSGRPGVPIWTEHRIVSTNQHPISMYTEEVMSHGEWVVV